jgi:hypothetical protein
MKTIATLIATLVATAAFATEPAKPVAPVATTAVTAPATPATVASAPTVAPEKCDAAKDKHCKVEKKAEVKPVKSQAPATKDAAKTAEPAKK